MERKPVIILEFPNEDRKKYFLKLYDEKVLSVLRTAANECGLSRTLKFELPPSSNDPLYVAEDEVPRRHAIFKKVKELEQDQWDGLSEEERPMVFWVYHFERIV